MICPNCGSSWPEEDRYCSNCGCRLCVDELAPKKGRHLIPVLLLVLMAVLGTIVYFVIRPGAAPAPSSETPWFTMRGTTLVDFNPAAYNGSNSLTVPDTIDGVEVLAIGDGCFYGCSNLTFVELPQGLQSIGASAFEGCSSLRGIFIPFTVTEIGDCAFRGCTDLEAICLTSGVQSIGANSFDQCDSLIYVLFSGGIAQWRGLYDDYISPFTYIYCIEGVYPQGTGAS